MSTKKKNTRKKVAKKAPKAEKTPLNLKRIVMWLSTLVVWGGIALALVLSYYAYDLPDVDKATSVDRRPGLSLLSVDGKVIATSGDLYGEAVQIHNLPDYLPQAVMATEDRRFYSHFGVDIIGLARALVTNVMSGRVKQGGSTLTQQVAKNLFLSPERSIKRKVQELLLALWLEKKFTKDQIFTLYLNRVYFGAGTYGVEAAARKYFSKPARHLSLYESALIAGLLKAPSRYNPRANPKLAEERTAVVLMNMVNAGYLTKAQAQQAKRHKNRVIKSAKPHKAGRYFADWVMDQVRDYVGPVNKDLTVVTTLDMGLQQLAEKEMRAILAKNAKKKQVSQAAIVALAPDGAVRAMVGGRNYGKSQFNRATQARRQPGSSFKPFVFLAGVERGLKADTKMKDEPFAIGSWKPRNYSGKYLGDITLAKALAESVNTVSVKVAQKVGFTRVVETAHRLGITSDLKAHPSIALGSSEVNLLELTAAYGPFANGGYGVFPFGIERIKDASGRILYQRTGGGTGRIVAPNHVAEINKMMKEVMISGTGKKANFNRSLGGKSGTSQAFRDAWFVGYSADLVLGVWMGNDNEKPMKKVSGAGLPAQLWGDVMKGAHVHAPPKALPGDKAPKAVQDVKGFFEKLFGN
ncbi:Multimodular transpeptidase-transglycosylase [Candidatus Terasakiella magnetica]|uniref:Multimodular transpeptidase-transglycosylase n=1 Tax=Candidatus Terasakiella magnetica TaxID=1867952 RepID=A0A1C3RGS7_9PROT|nr:PBP1A family penicillin-binding protein [Candidatus Terasakiella magnetica]SCA56458.1 Multimodular transpeptidase-transglycosylase [Candidatus Terasakiella magnetica]